MKSKVETPIMQM